MFCLSHLFSKIKKISLATQIFVALFLGVTVGACCCFSAAGISFTANYLRPIGTIFINLLKMIVVPVVFLSIIDGVVSMGDLKKLGSVGLKSILCFLVTSILACVTGLVLASAFKNFGMFPKLNIVGEAKFNENSSSSFTDVLLGLFTSADMLTVIIVAVMVGVAIIKCENKAKHAADVLNSFYCVCETITHSIIKVSPIGVFAMVSWVVATQGVKIIGTLTAAIVCAYIGYFIFSLVVYSAITKFFTKVTPLEFFKTSFPAMIFAFTSASSVATIPISKKCCNEMGVDDGVSSFVIPLGATINMNGTAIYQCVATVLLASCCGLSLSLGQMIFAVTAIVASSVGTAGVPGSATITLAMVLSSIGVPVDAIMIIYGIDRIFDMGRTVVNITGDIASAVCVSAIESKKRKI